MAGTFDFGLGSRVAVELAPDEMAATSFRGWEFTSKPATPYRPKFKIALHGMRWYLNADGTYDVTTNPTNNAGRLRGFYIANRTWDVFNFVHESLGTLVCRFTAPVNIPAGEQNSFGTIAAFDVTIIQQNPGY